MTKSKFLPTEIENVVKGRYNGAGYVTVPGSWVGRKVRILLLDEKSTPI